jgi:hypothetical protein
MVKKGQPKGPKPGSGAGKKTASAPPAEDDSFIVFSNSDKVPKQRKPANSGEGPSGASGPDLLGEAPKRPDVKKLIGGASWTGKLPVNMLSEHCQKQKWEKPEYTMVSRDCMFNTSLLTDAHRLGLLKDIPRWLFSRQRIQKHRSSLAYLHSNSLRHISTSPLNRLPSRPAISQQRMRSSEYAVCGIYI